MRTVVPAAFVILVLLTMCALPLEAETVRWIPAAASNAGLRGTQWTTDLWIYNKVSDRPITVYLAFLPDEGGVVDPVEVSVDLPVMNPVHIRDVVGSLFGEDRPGAIRLRSEHEFEARSSTLNSGSDVGVFGQGIPAVAKGDDIASGLLLGASNLPTAAGSRTNLGLLNTGDETVHVFVFVYGNTYQDYIGRMEIDLGPLGWWQRNVFDEIGVSRAVENAMVNPFVLADEQPLISYLSVLDNASGDGTYVQEINYLPAYTEALDWTIEFAVTSVDATVNLLTVVIDDNEPEVFTDFSETVQVTLDAHVGLFQVCWSVEATAADGQNGRVSVDYDGQSSRGDGGGGRTSFGGQGDFGRESCERYAPMPRWDP